MLKICFNILLIKYLFKRFIEVYWLQLSRRVVHSYSADWADSGRCWLAWECAGAGFDAGVGTGAAAGVWRVGTRAAPWRCRRRRCPGCPSSIDERTQLMRLESSAALLECYTELLIAVNKIVVDHQTAFYRITKEN